MDMGFLPMSIAASLAGLAPLKLHPIDGHKVLASEDPTEESDEQRYNQDTETLTPSQTVGLGG